jgi:hypothetical protein
VIPTCTTPEAESHPWTAKKWQGHLLQLVIFTILVAISWKDIRGAAKYFAVPKSETCARAIFNGRVCSRKLQSPPPVNLPFLPDIIDIMNSFDGPAEVLVADIRHWFHQIPLNESVSQHFCVGSGGSWFRWRTLPMGFSWAPYVAQSLAWCLLLFCPDNATWPFKLDRQTMLNQPPSYLRLNCGGFITVFYDNIIAFGSRHNIALLDRRWFGCSRTKGTFAHFGVTMKECFCSTRERAENLSPKLEFTYLGVDFMRTRKCIRDGRDVFHLQWRQNKPKLERWLANCDGILRSSPENQATRRQIARVCGRFLWRFGLTRLPLCELSDIIAIIRKVATGSGWDDKAELSAEQYETIRTNLDILRANAWLDYALEPHREVITACSDSSQRSWGYVVYTDSGVIERGFQWSNSDFLDEHIFLKELIAACRTITHCINMNQGRPTEVRIGIDNSAAGHAIRHMHSSNVHAEVQLKKLWKTLTESKSTVHTITLLSEQNAADAASRGRRASDEQLRNCARILAKAQLDAGL